MKTDFEQHIRNLFEHYSETPSPECWSKLSDNLDTISKLSTGSSNVSSIFTQIVKSSIGKIGIGIAVVGSITTSVYLLTKNNNDIVQDSANTTNIVENTQMVPTAENNVLTMDSPVDETAIPLPAEIENKTTKEKTTFSQNADIKTQMVKEDYAVAKEVPASVPANIHATESQAVPAKVVATEEKRNVNNQPYQTIPKNEASSSKQIEEEVFPVEETSKDDLIQNETEETEIRQPIFSIPNIFTPNGDNINDFFIIEQIPDIESSHLYIYNLSGRVLYEKMNYKNDWNGNHLPDGVYLYIYKFIYKGNEFIRKGTLTIKRR